MQRHKRYGDRKLCRRKGDRGSVRSKNHLFPNVRILFSLMTEEFHVIAMESWMSIEKNNFLEDPVPVSGNDGSYMVTCVTAGER